MPSLTDEALAGEELIAPLLFVPFHAPPLQPRVSSPRKSGRIPTPPPSCQSRAPVPRSIVPVRFGPRSMKNPLGQTLFNTAPSVRRRVLPAVTTKLINVSV